MKLIAFAGRAGSGKNTAARGLSAHYETSELAMADPLYDALGALIGLSPFDDNDLRTLCEDRDFKRAAHKALGGLSPREALQQLGDWVRSSLGQDFLLRRAEERLRVAPRRKGGVTRRADPGLPVHLFNVKVSTQTGWNPSY